MTKILYPIDDSQVHRYSSIDQFQDFLSVWKKGGWAPIVFDQLDGITCETVKTHPVVLSWGGDLGYIFPEAHCTYSRDKFITVDKQEVATGVLPACFGGQGELYEYWVDKKSFVNFDNGSSLGVHNKRSFRTGLSYVKADENLPPAQ